MPIYEYACMECESHFEELVRSAEQAIACPDCGAGNVLKQLSTFAVAGVPRSRSSVAAAGWLLRRLLRLLADTCYVACGHLWSRPTQAAFVVQPELRLP